MTSRFNPIVSPPYTPAFGGLSLGEGNRPVNSPPFTSSSFQTPPPQMMPSSNSNTTTMNASSTTNNNNSARSIKNQQVKQPKPSLALSCQSPDGLSIHTLIRSSSTTFTIQTNTLPLNHTTSKIINTSLPSWLNKAFSIDSPIELLCVDNDTSFSNSLKSENFNNNTMSEKVGRKIYLPLLCVYTMKTVYILQIYIIPSSSSLTSTSNNNTSFEGKLESIHEPFESYLNSSSVMTVPNNISNTKYNISIQRVRSAPYTHLCNGTLYNTFPFIPRGCIAVLLVYKKKVSFTKYKLEDSDDEIDDRNNIEEEEMCHSKLLLYHGVDNDYAFHNDNANGNNPLSSSLVVRNDDNNHNNITIMEMNTIEPIVDFTFLSSLTTSTSHTTSSTTSMSSLSSSLWNGLSVALSTTQGLIYTLTPVVFHGMGIPKHILLDTVKHLKTSITSISSSSTQDNTNEKENIQSTSNTSTALTHHNSNDTSETYKVLYRRNMAAIAYIKDVFGITLDDDTDATMSIATSNNDDPADTTHISSATKRKKNRNDQNRSYIVTANIFNHTNRKRNASSWPIGLQGPVYVPSDSCVHEIVCMESLPSSSGDLGRNNDFSGYTSSLVLGCGKNGQCVQYVIIPSGINSIPRFTFESSDDSRYLDGLVDNTGLLIEEIILESDHEDHENGEEELFDSIPKKDDAESGVRNVVLYIDPVDSNMVHQFSKFGVVSITTNALKVMKNRLNNIVVAGGCHDDSKDDDTVKTKAWSSVDVLNREKGTLYIAGVSISGDAKLGHILVVILSDGQTEAINMTAAQYLNEDNDIDENLTRASKSSEEKESDEALKSLAEVPPLQEKVNPLLQKISTGLSGMSKIVGGSTKPCDITPGILATFLSTKHANEQDIIIPLRELHSLLVSRLPYLKSIREHQKMQLRRLDEMMNELEERMKQTNEKLTANKTNSKLLSQKSTDILSTAREMAPTLTDAEQAYFKDIQRYDTECCKFEERLKELREQYKVLNDGIDDAIINDEVKQEHLGLCTTLLESQRQKINESKVIIDRSKYELQRVLADKGIIS